jgi:micrococcal nuclease
MSILRLVLAIATIRLLSRAFRVFSWIAIALALVALRTITVQSPDRTARYPAVTVQRWVDGDTLHATGGLKVRLIGIDAPEASPSDRARSQARRLGVPVEEIVRLGQAAREFATSLAPPGTTLHLERDVQPTDRYGRTLAYLWTADGRLVQEEILKAGWADLLTIPPNVRHTERLRSAWREARENHRGIWR